MTTKTLKDVLNDANPGSVDSALQKMRLGDILRQATLQHVHVTAPALDANQLGTLQGIGLPKSARCARITRAQARKGTATVPANGLLAVQAEAVTPATQQIGVAPNGDIVVLAADVWTDLEIQYEAIKGDVVELVGFPVASNVATLPAALTAQGVQRLLDVNAVVATATGRKIILTASGGTPSAGQCNLNLACSTVTFASADAVTSCNLSLLVSPAVDTGALLEADSAGIV